MVELIVNDIKHILIGKDDKCPICESPRDEMFFTWRLPHGEANSSCCGAIYQLKGYFIENPTDEEKELNKMLDGEYIELCIKPEFLEPLRQVLKETGKRNINDEEVIEETLRLARLDA